MKKLSFILILVLTLMLTGGGFAENPEKCTVPKGTNIVVLHIGYGPIPMPVAEDVKITILEIEEVDTPDGKEKVARFSLSYDKPKLPCQKHGSHTYDEYKRFIANDNAFVKYSLLKCNPGV